jgi:hypothetical protein
MRRIVLLAALAAAVLVPAGSVLAESATDKAMAQSIGLELKESGQLRDYRIGVKYEDGVAWLSGSVANAQQRDIAVQMTESMAGVVHVICKLEIDESSDTQPAEQPAARQQALGGRVRTADYAATTGKMRPGRQAPSSRSQASQHMPTRSGTYGAKSQRSNMPMPLERTAALPTSGIELQQAASYVGDGPANMGPAPMAYVPSGPVRAVSYDNAQMPGNAWPSYASYPNYAALTYPRQYSPAAWPYIGPFYPYPQVPLGWRKVSLEWDDGWWFLDFSSCRSSH